MTNIRVQRFSNPEELRVCESERDVAGEGWAVLIPKTAAQETASEPSSPNQLEILPEGGWCMQVAEARCHEPYEVFCDGEFVGDALTVEVVREEPFAELVYRPLPPLSEE